MESYMVKNKSVRGLLVKNTAQKQDKSSSFFDNEYRQKYSSSELNKDSSSIKALSKDKNTILYFVPQSSDENLLQIKLFKKNETIALSTILPIIENFGFSVIEEKRQHIVLDANNFVNLSDFKVQIKNEIKSLKNKLIKNVESTMQEVFLGNLANDTLNKLILLAGIEGRHVILLKAMTQYLLQTNLPFSNNYIAEVLCTYTDVITDFILLWDNKFNPHLTKKHSFDALILEITNKISKISSLDDDRILNAILSLIKAIVRTNFYQRESSTKARSYLSFKIESAKLNFLPKPVPLYEVFVYSHQFEAIHLRFDKIARGGFRWSDRKEDYRTEILGLVKAQSVKNSIIVPTGAKGGFICKNIQGIKNRQQLQLEVIDCYKQFICGLLDITDNIVKGKVIRPENVVCYDGVDPYLVVAADKGTATFSDYANEVSMRYKFWLGDAFASGGSAGYDHKKMAITARGAWISAKRHFRHLGIDIQKQDFSVIGIGDMSGDVFGNGMLMSKHICLKAAFNHQHIFLDPNPNAAKSFTERQRLFNLPNSSWGDYDRKKLSTGGAIYARSLKVIQPTPEIRKWLRLDKAQYTPNELIKIILQAKADLLYNGGIGTYIKAENESQEEAHDKSNDEIRVNATQVSVAVIVEGGNLGVTQLGRIEFAKLGGLIFTDAIDNSAGVDCSDHEVNIKILLTDIMHSHKLSLKERNQLLNKMTDSVATSVLRDNYLQTQILKYAEARSATLFAQNITFINKLEQRGDLDRAVEFLPNENEINERLKIGMGLTSPELSVLLAYAKKTLYGEILQSSLVHDSNYDNLLLAYFPQELQTVYAKNILRHYLKKEIIATQLANLVVNRVGITFAFRLKDEFRCSIVHVINTFWMIYQLIDASSVYAAIEALDGKVPANVQVELLIELKKAIERSVRRVMASPKEFNDLVVATTDFKKNVLLLINNLPNVLNNLNYPYIVKRENKYLNSKIPKKLAQIISRISALSQIISIVKIAHDNRLDPLIVAENYFYLGRMLRMDWLRKEIIKLPEANRWQSLVRSAIISNGQDFFNQLVNQAIKLVPQDKNFIRKWMELEPGKVKYINEVIDEVQNYAKIDLAILSATVNELGSVVAENYCLV
jgi:glutamate dehydrogenase